jgi:uncharacterized zinc-type alcohol dehydrogenase-like protein
MLSQAESNHTNNWQCFLGNHSTRPALAERPNPENFMLDTIGYAVQQANGPLAPFRFQRRQPGANDIAVDILYCGICHSDLLMAHDGMGHSTFPMVPGHEIIGRVAAVGSAATRYKIGDLVGIGCIIDSCRHCSSCAAGDEHYCVERFTSSFNGRERGTGAITYGGYSTLYVVDEKYALKIPDGLDPAAAAPLLCGGITTYLPLKRYGIGAGHRVGILGLGGLGHMAIKFAKAFGAAPVMLTSSSNKVQDAQKLGAVDVILTSDSTQMVNAAGSLDFILNTISAPHDPNVYLALLKRGGTMCLVGMPEKPLTVHPASLVFGDKAMSGSLIGGIAATQDMLNFCAEHGIAADIEKIAIQDVNTAWERMERNDVKYRFVIDMQTLRT